MFIKVAEKGGYITQITRMIVKKSFEMFSGTKHKFSINLTSYDLKEKTFLSFLDEQFQLYGIDPTQVTWEVLEEVRVVQNENVIDTIRLLKEKGCMIAIDDFGIESSNFSRLLELQIDTLKIDGSFIKEIYQNDTKEKIVTAIVSFAKSLGIKTVAEFVENEEIYKKVDELGIDYSQGYFFC